MLKTIIAAAATSTIALASGAAAHHHELDADYVIGAAALALPSAMEATTTIRHEAADGTHTVVQEGSNDLVCTVSSVDSGELANRLSVWCVPESVVAMNGTMDTIREAADSREDFFARVNAAVESGELVVPERGLVGYAYRAGGDSWGVDLTEVDGSGWQIVMTPFATGVELGLPEEAEGTMPWVMASGTPFSHIMVYGSSE